MIEAAIGFVVLFAMIVLRVPIAIAMATVGLLGFAAISGWSASLSLAASVIVDTPQTYSFSMLPLFILMGNFVSRAGLAAELYKTSQAFLGHRRGGLPMATVVASGGFSAICGSSLATAATMAKVAMPSMRHYGVPDRLAAGSIAAGGTLGVLIPPSIILVLYGILTEQSIRDLFAAGLIPGILGVLFYMAAVQYVTLRDRDSGGVVPATSWTERLQSLRSASPVLVLFLVVMGGIYAGAFTPTEAAGIGAGGAFLIALFRRMLTLKLLLNIFAETAITTVTLFSILIAAMIFSNFVVRAGFADSLLALIRAIDAWPSLIIMTIILIYFILGMMLESVSMILLTVPILFPIIVELGYDPIWFGIVVVVVAEIGLLTPPIGLNVFVLTSSVPNLSSVTAFRGVTPFWIVDILRLAFIVTIPGLALWLPGVLYH